MNLLNYILTNNNLKWESFNYKVLDIIKDYNFDIEHSSSKVIQKFKNSKFKIWDIFETLNDAEQNFYQL